MNNETKITTQDAAEILQTSAKFVRITMQIGILPIGFARKTSSKWSYYISSELIKKYFGEHGKRLKVKEAAQILGISPQGIRLGMQLQKLPIGIAVKINSKWNYHISQKLLFDYMGKNLTKGDKAND